MHLYLLWVNEPVKQNWKGINNLNLKVEFWFATIYSVLLVLNFLYKNELSEDKLRWNHNQ